MGLMTMLLAMVMTIFVAFTRSFSDDQATSNNSNTVSVAMNELTRVIRSGTELTQSGTDTNVPVFTVAKPNLARLSTYLDTDALDPEPLQVEFEVTSSHTLIERRWDATESSLGYFSFPSYATSERTISRNLDSSTGALFTYLDVSGNEILPVSGKVPTSLLPSIAAVKVVMTVQSDATGGASPATIENTVGIPNLGTSRIGQ
ncbi:type II secretion system protein [Salinibacterium sp. NK8237]|uniref:type II secretion system protein n=1 Tax=Salinibacterium sp. NK8237 TaxID=2792038 RepID=UPI001E382069|nr:type II secretion system protein [Salinibacterium sp. NK8237]